MLSDANRDYYRQRSSQERLRAEATRDRSARRVHEELADRYAALADPHHQAAA